ncbi:MAG: excinuclease ABC subunit UvrB [Bacteriovoracaceae bacterium]|nr:excinuclease ABC subunit UvrB [Bacteriovoracaceae bacterium]
MSKFNSNIFDLKSNFKPSGDQPGAIRDLIHEYVSGRKEQTLLGVTGSGKTFTMANIIQALGKKTLVLAHNKTLAAQLYSEFKEFFPNNAVEYFVSYYDYYQPEAYVPGTDTYIEKDSSINEEIDRLRHCATRSLLERDDVIVVSSVSCIYGIGSSEEYESQKITLFVGDTLDRDDFLRELVNIQFERGDMDFYRGKFRARGDVVEVFPAHEDSSVIRVEFFGDEIENISMVDPLRGRVLQNQKKVTIYPKSHYVVGREKLDRAIKTIGKELGQRLECLQKEEKLLEKQRLEQRTLYDLEMLEEIGFCQGIENYSRHLTGLPPGKPPPTLIDFFAKDFLFIVDESHMAIPQARGMFKGDRSRKQTLVDYGFRLPSALDNRPLKFSEFEEKTDLMLYVSATPVDYELHRSGGEFVEQIIRPTGLLDPVVEVRNAEHQVDDLLVESRQVIKNGGRILVTTLTKKLAEELSSYYESVGEKVKYLHSDVTTLSRMQIIRDLRLGKYDILVGINLLREGLDIPEVQLVGILDADKEGFLRSDRALIQTIGRASRNVNGKVILYSYKITKSMDRAISETKRRREIQAAYNEKNNIIPKTIQKRVSGGVLDILRVPDEKSSKKDLVFRDISGSVEDIEQRIVELKKEMKLAARELRFEDAAGLRDEIKMLTDARFVL